MHGRVSGRSEASCSLFALRDCQVAGPARAFKSIHSCLQRTKTGLRRPPFTPPLTPDNYKGEHVQDYCKRIMDSQLKHWPRVKLRARLEKCLG
eukprot:6186315-Pleurochrysis_carterae.AAC.1